VFIGARGIQENYQNCKKIAAEHMVGTFQKSCSKRCSGLLRFWHEVRRGARRIKILTPKKIVLIPQGHSLDICGHQKIEIAKTKPKKFKEKFQKIPKKIGRDIFQKPFFNAFFAFSEEFIFFVPQFFLKTMIFFFLMIHFSTI